jgi:hypothetical protein
LETEKKRKKLQKIQNSLEHIIRGWKKKYENYENNCKSHNKPGKQHVFNKLFFLKKKRNEEMKVEECGAMCQFNVAQVCLWILLNRILVCKLLAIIKKTMFKTMVSWYHINTNLDISKFSSSHLMSKSIP